MPKSDIEYSGWGPCVHSDEDRARFSEWLKPIIADVNVPEGPEYGGLLESLLWMLNELGAYPTCASDQWVACICEGEIAGKKVKTRIEGDTFLIAVAESYRWWREKRAELTALPSTG